MSQNLPYYSFKTYMSKKYGTTLHSIPIDLELGCPNRDEEGKGGCTFCPSNAARAVQTLNAQNIQEQITYGISFAKQRYKAKKFMLYIQAYTGTFTSVINQKKTYSQLLSKENFSAISIGTRPDCLSKKTLEYLEELNQEIDVYIDLGIQTLNDNTLKRINRGHDSKCSLDAIKNIKKAGLKVFAHIIIGLPNETRQDWESCIKQLVKMDIDGIKIHNLHIIKNTQLHQEYIKKPFKTLNEYEYAEELINLIRHIPNHIPIIRISTDTLKEELIAPLWHMQKGQFVEYVTQSMLYRDYYQGEFINKQNLVLPKQNIFSLEDKSKTIWDKIYKDYYHPKSGAYVQAKELFIKQSKLIQKLEKKDVELLDIGFGMGYNSLLCIKQKKENFLKITALDLNRQIIKASANLNENEDEKNILNTIYKTSFYKDEKNELNLILGDARHTIKSLNKKFDIIFLDAFLHNLNPSLLSIDFICLLKNLLEKEGIIICTNTYHKVKAAFCLAKFTYEEFFIEKTDIKALIVKHGEKLYKEDVYKDPYLVYREKQILNN
ncbi:TIGR01212 family radical SAM protein [Malaciobacter mytili LMG 24559]|uniref:TIGR01212 family radical SAM protein n=1 Tax=Malaciobacter mytili LMG 24559 TaxID=1032238 RepID=A0AAX2AGE1_9BACT|nr:TIGR01212 family radical SAM protein [Malaciobacter mytili]AXH14337.1 TIGR01212 family radical SAM protein [Malaciobacter mytili LMG 24559]RXK16087.1 TIGR01212 family radical SAM protein [Malaciobacter mytili LMG 24559]